VEQAKAVERQVRAAESLPHQVRRRVMPCAWQGCVAWAGAWPRGRCLRRPGARIELHATGTQIGAAGTQQQQQQPRREQAPRGRPCSDLTRPAVGGATVQDVAGLAEAARGAAAAYTAALQQHAQLAASTSGAPLEQLPQPLISKASEVLQRLQVGAATSATSGRGSSRVRPPARPAACQRPFRARLLGLHMRHRGTPARPPPTHCRRRATTCTSALAVIYNTTWSSAAGRRRCPPAAPCRAPAPGRPQQPTRQQQRRRSSRSRRSTQTPCLRGSRSTVTRSSACWWR